MPLGLISGQGGLDGCVCGSKSMGIEFDSLWEHIFEVSTFSKKFHLCGKTNRQTDRQTDGQTDKHPQPCSKNKPFGKPSVASRQLEIRIKITVSKAFFFIV